MHGPPPGGIAQLEALAKRSMRRDLCGTYCAQMLYCLCKSIIKDFGVPSYVEMIDDRPKDNRTGEEIVNDVANELRKRIGARERGDT